MSEKQKTEAQETSESEPSVKELEQALTEEKKRSESYLTRMKYLQADLENLQRRADRQIEEIRRFSNECMITALLEVIDELEMAVDSSRSCESADALVQGVQMTLKKLKKVLENEGVSPIECLGKPFDPAKHHALAKVEREDVPDSTVVEEIRRGYMMREKVIRPSIVKVSVKPQSKSQQEKNTNE